MLVRRGARRSMATLILPFRRSASPSRSRCSAADEVIAAHALAAVNQSYGRSAAADQIFNASWGAAYGPATGPSSAHRTGWHFRGFNLGLDVQPLGRRCWSGHGPQLILVNAASCTL